MKQQSKQTGWRARFCPIHWRALGRGLLFALLLTQQAWAGLFCCCEPLHQTPPVVAQSTHPACHAQAETTPTGVAKTHPQPAPPRLLLCCAMPQSEAERVTLLTPNQTVLPTTLPPLYCDTPAAASVMAGGNSPPPLRRPLYLALSCWLI